MFLELLSGTRSPIVPSPPPNTINSMYERSVFMTPANSTFSDKPQCISMDMSVSQKNIIAPMLTSLFQNSASSHHKRNDSSKFLALLFCFYFSHQVVILTFFLSKSFDMVVLEIDRRLVISVTKNFLLTTKF